MARRKKKPQVRRAQVSPRRTASPSRELVALSPQTGAIASTLATGTALGATAFGFSPAVTAASAAVVAGAFGAQVGGRTIGKWISLRRNAIRSPEQAALFSRDGVGIVFDGRTASACVEVTPRPWQLTTITAAGLSEAPVITAEQLRRQLNQYGLRCSRLTAICAGYKFAARDNAAGVLDTLIGPVSAPLGGTTVLVVSMDLDADALGQAYRRAHRDPVTGNRSLPDGLCRTLTLAATRVCHSLSENGFGGRLMSSQRLREFHDMSLAQVASSLSDPRWETCGPPNGVHTRTYIPARGYWNAKAAGSWHHLQSHRQFTTLTLTPKGESEALAQPLITYLVGSGDALSKASGYGLRPAVGQQVAGLVAALPVSTSIPLRTVGAIIDENRQLGFGIPAGGAGMFVGSRSDKTRVFVAVTPASDPLWLCGPKIFALQMVARLSTQDLRISVMVDDPDWRYVVSHRGTPTLTAGTLGMVPADVVVCTPQWWELNRDKCLNKAVILVTEGEPGRLATNNLTVVTDESGSSYVAVNVDAQNTAVGWELTPLERRTLLGDVDVTGTAPVEAADLQLSEFVQLPVAPPRRRSRRRAPTVPAVGTVAQANPDAVLAALAPAAAPVHPARPRRRLPRPPAEGEIRFVPQAQVFAGPPPPPAPRPVEPDSEPVLETSAPLVPPAQVAVEVPPQYRAERVPVRPADPDPEPVSFPGNEIHFAAGEELQFESPGDTSIRFVSQEELETAELRSAEPSVVYAEPDPWTAPVEEAAPVDATAAVILTAESPGIEFVPPAQVVDAPRRPPGRHRRPDDGEEL